MLLECTNVWYFALFTKVLACLKQSLINHSGEGLGDSDAKSNVAHDLYEKERSGTRICVIFWQRIRLYSNGVLRI